MSLRDDLRRGARQIGAAARRLWKSAGRRRLSVRDRRGVQRVALPLTLLVVLAIIALLRPPLLLLLALALGAPLLFGWELSVERHDAPRSGG